MNGRSSPDNSQETLLLTYVCAFFKQSWTRKKPVLKAEWQECYVDVLCPGLASAVCACLLAALVCTSAENIENSLHCLKSWAGSFGLDKKVSVLDLSNYWTLSPVPEQSSTSKPWLIKEPNAQGGEENLELPRLAEHFWCVTCCFNKKVCIPCVTCRLASSVERIKDKHSC